MTYALMLIAVVIIIALAQLHAPKQREPKTRPSAQPDWKHAVYNPKQYRRPRGH